MNTFSPLKAQTKQIFSSAIGASLAISLTKLIDQHQNKTHLIITDTMQSSNQLFDELTYLMPKGAIFLFPDLETLPYDQYSPSEDIISERLKALYALENNKKNMVLIASINTLLKRLPPSDFLNKASFVLSVGDTFDMNQKRNLLEKSGYVCVNQVISRGEFAVRGSLFDIFPMGSDSPFRIDLFDDEVDSIRTFNIDTQRSETKIKTISILPTREVILDHQSINTFAEKWQNIFDERGIEGDIYQNILKAQAVGGIEYYLPLFFNHCPLITEFLDKNAIISHIGQTALNADKYLSDVHNQYEQLASDIQRPILKPNEVFATTEELFLSFKKFPQTQFLQNKEKQKGSVLNFDELPDLGVHYQFKQPFKNLINFLNQTTKKTCFSADSLGRLKMLEEHLLKLNIRPKMIDHLDDFYHKKNEEIEFFLIHSPFSKGFISDDYNLITESELFSNQTPNYRKKGSKQKDDDGHTQLKDLSELTLGAAVVHINYGVGRYEGLTKLDFGTKDTEFLTLSYKNEEKLYVPIQDLNLISRYSGTNLENAPINQLGSDKWEKTKEKAYQKIKDVAAELLDIYAQKEIKEGFQSQLDEKDYLAFAEKFPFETTKDQQQAIDEVLLDMQASKPMDRLVCGDVGFGKTEVAMRAAFIAVSNQKQVAILVPTTLLAQQHYNNFSDRFADYPVEIEVLSRFKTQKEQTQVLERLQKGQVDIIIATHKLLSKNIEFSNIGLLIIDEEHRFGVTHKEKIKSLRANIDILTMTATPIPRTLNMALSSIRDLSIISTPPLKRLSVKTFIRDNNKQTIREAIMREALRGGQVYYLHNKVETIFSKAESLIEQFPDLNIAVAHGQMRERELERIMYDFQHKRYHVLVCTTIIETGIDIPNANTIIIDRADNFGLAQLHQLRGRVGRSHHQAYAYLLTPPWKSLTKDAQKRLEALSENESLGAGFILANHDLEIRGAGELLGSEQSGNIEGIGFSLYLELLDRTVKAFKSGKRKDEINFDLNTNQTEIELRIPSLIPEDYMPDVHQRLSLYKRISMAESTDKLNQLKIEMIDRFGLLPDACHNLFQISELKLTAQKLGIFKIELYKKGGRMNFNNPPNFDPVSLIRYVQLHPKDFQLSNDGKLSIKKEFNHDQARIEFIKLLLSKLTPLSINEKINA